VAQGTTTVFETVPFNRSGTSPSAVTDGNYNSPLRLVVKIAEVYHDRRKERRLSRVVLL
jgi:hypothetical protein